MITRNNVHLDDAWKTPQFWLIWGVLCLNVTAGIGVISMASPMLQDIFGAKLLGVDTVADLTAAQKAAIAAAAAGLVGLISLFNSARPHLLGFAVGQDRPQEHLFHLLRPGHRRSTALLPTWGHLGLAALFVAVDLHHPVACTAAVLRPCRPISPTFSARRWSARSTDA